jgi:outer membrane protein assembly factor BamD
VNVRLIRTLLLLTACLLVAPAAEGRPRKETPEKLYEAGVRQMKRGYYDEAIISFDKVRNHFPLNPFSVLAELRVADCLYEKADFISAVDAYQQFVRLHPRHDELDYAHMRIGRSYFKQANRIPAKDQTYTELTLHALIAFAERFPESDYLDEVEDIRGKCLNRLARAETQVGDYYYWRGVQQRKPEVRDVEFAAASRRYLGVIEDFDTCDVKRRALYRYGMSLHYLGRSADAIPFLERVVADYPGTLQSRRAGRQLLAVAAAAAAPPPEVPGEADGH